MDYGPVYSFWLFSFERYNGILGHQPTNNRCVETQILERFLEDNFLRSSDLPETFAAEFTDLFPHSGRDIAVHTLDQLHEPSETLEDHSLSGEGRNWSLQCISSLLLPKKSIRAAFTSPLLDQLVILYNKLYPSVNFDSSSIPSIFLKYSSITVSGFVYGSESARVRNSVVMAEWETSILGPVKQYVDVPITASFQSRPVLVRYYAKHTVTVNSEITSHLFAVVSWFFPHPNHCLFGKPVTIWCKGLFDTCILTVVPVQLLSSLFVYTEDIVDDETVVMVTPLL